MSSRQRRPVFVWNEGSFAAHLREAGHSVVVSSADLPVARRAPLVVLAEFTSAAGRLSDFGGLNLMASMLSEHRPVPPMLLCSFAPRRMLFQLEDNRGEVAKLPIPFVRLPTTVEQLAGAVSKAEALSPMLHAWFRQSVLQAPYAMWLHDLARDFNRGLTEFAIGLRRLRRQVRARQGSGRMDVSQGVELLVVEGLKAVDAGDLELASGVLDRLTGLLKRAQEPLAMSGVLAKRQYSVVVVEDDAAERDAVRAGLGQHFDEVLAFDSGVEALAVLEQRAGEGAPFDAVISDWDLREGGQTNGPMQDLQGPDLLVRAAEFCGGPLIGLTSLPGEVVSGILNVAPTEVRSRLSWFPKRDGKPNFQELVGHIAEKVLAADRLHREHPSSFKPWTKHGLGDHYVDVRRQGPDEQLRFFEAVRTRASQIVAAYSGSEGSCPKVDCDLTLSPPSGGARYHRARLQDALCGRLVVLALHAKLPKSDILDVFSRLFPTRDRSIPANNWLSMLGLPSKQSGKQLDAGKGIKLMPHEIEWLEHNKATPASSPALTGDEQGAAEELERDLRLIAKVVGMPVVPDDDSGSSGDLYVEEVESAIGHIEREALALQDRTRLRAEIARVLDHEGVKARETLHNKYPQWRERLTAL